MSTRQAAFAITLGNARLLSIAALLALLFLSGALLRPLIGGNMFDPMLRAGLTETQSVQIIGALVYAVSLAGLWWRFDKLRWSKELLLIAALMGIIVLSTLWSSNPPLTLRRSIAFIGTTTAGITFALWFTRAQILFLLNRFIVLFVFANFALSLVAPHYAFHQNDGFSPLNYTGLLRGTYPIKNDLGHYLSLFLVILVVGGRQNLPRLLWFATILLGALMLLGTNCMEGTVSLAAALVATYLLDRMAAVRSGQERVLMAMVICGAAILLIVFGADLYALVLRLAGRDPTLSNRTIVWQLVLMAGANHWLLGSGFGAWIGGSASDMLKGGLYGNDVGNAHNGFLQSWVELGVLGLMPLVLLLVLSGNRLARSLFTDRGDVFTRTSIALLIFIVAANMSSAHLLAYNDLTWSLLVTIAYLAVPAYTAQRRRLPLRAARRAVPVASRNAAR